MLQLDENRKKWNALKIIWETRSVKLHKIWIVMNSLEEDFAFLSTPRLKINILILSAIFFRWCLLTKTQREIKNLIKNILSLKTVWICGCESSCWKICEKSLKLFRIFPTAEVLSPIRNMKRHYKMHNIIIKWSSVEKKFWKQFSMLTLPTRDETLNLWGKY